MEQNLHINTYRQEVVSLILKATHLKLMAWNEGMIFNEFIPALWRTFLKNDVLSKQALDIQKQLGDEKALELLAKEFNALLIQKV